MKSILAVLGLMPLCGLFHVAAVSAEKESPQNNSPGAAKTAATYLVYIGTYTSAKSKGIYASRFNPATGSLTDPQIAAETKNPTFLALHPNGRWLYAVGEISNFGGTRAGAVSAYSIEEPTGKLELLNEQPSGGGGPCHVSVDKTGKCALVANYGTGSIAALPIEADGKLGAPSAVIQHHGSSVNHERQAGPHAHFITPDPANRVALACDLGLDKVLLYQLDPATGGLHENEPPSANVKPGSGPRHLAFHPNGRWVYLINELSCTMTAFEYDARAGALSEIQTLSTLPDDFKGQNTCAEVQVHPSGKFVYGSNRGHDSIAVFSVDAKTGKLSLTQHQPTGGKTPRHFTLDPTNKWLLAENQDSDSVVVFAVDAATGRLALTGQKIQVGSPVCLLFVPAR